MIRNCLECSDKLLGREDKKFCSDCCRNAFNNKINKDRNNYMRIINNRLRRNYRILNELNSQGKARVARKKLVMKGFDFDFYTNVRQTKKGNTYFFLYDQGYKLLENNIYVLVKKTFSP